MLPYGWDIIVMTFIHICTCSSCCTPVLVLRLGPGPVLHVYVHIRTIRSPWIQVRCQSCRVDCIRQSDLCVTVLLHQSSLDRSAKAYWLHPVLSGRIAFINSDSCASIDWWAIDYTWLSHDYYCGIWYIMTWNISNYIVVVFLLHTYVVCFMKTILVLRRGVSIFKNKSFL